MPEIDDKKLAESHEMNQFYRSLAMVHSNAIARVMRHQDTADIVARAVVEVDRMRSEENQLAEKAKGTCGVGQIWNETLRKCVPIE